MADVTTTFAAKDESFARTVNKLQERLAGFSSGVEGFNRRVSSMANGFQGMIGPLVGIGAAVLGAKGAMDSFRNALDMGGRLDDLTKTTGASAGELAILQRAFQLAGSSADAVGPAMNRLNRFMAEAGNGSAAQQAALTSLGFTYQDLANKTPLTQMRMLAERIGAIGSPAQRTAAAMEIFGKSGGELVPLFREFNSEISKAEGQLGGLPAILDSNAQSLADMGDVMDALSSKFDEFTIGLIAGVRGAEDFSTALANIDAAGFGQGIGQSLRIAFEQPLLTSKIIGQTLLVGAKEAGNNLINAALTAGNAWVKTVSAAEYAEGIGLRIRAGLLEALNAFNKVLASSIKTILLEPFAAIPGLVGDPFRMALASVKNIQATLDATSKSNYALWTQGGELIKGSFQDAVNNTQVLTEDWLGVVESANQAAQYIQQASDYVATTMIPAIQTAVTSAQQIDLSMQNSALFSETIKMNLNESSLGAANAIAPAFSLAAGSAAQMSEHLNNTSTYAEESSNWLGAGLSHSQGISLNGSSFAAQAMLAAAAIGNAKVDARITSDLFTGLSDRMNQAVNGTSAMLDQMRESFHFGRQTSDQVYAKLREGGMNINDATKAAADYMANQNKADADLRSAENAVRIAENQRDRAHERADRMEKAGQERSAHELRMRADAEFTKKLEDLRPMLEKATDNARKLLEAGGETAGKKLDDAGQTSGDKLINGATIAAERIANAVGPGKTNDHTPQDTFTFTELIYKFLSQTFDDFKQRIPQHALS
jgi:hypothetical protein